MIYDSDTYQESYKCNFLGLSKFCTLPKHVTDYALVNVEPPVPTDKVTELSLNVLKGYRVQLHTGQPPMEKSSGKLYQGIINWTGMETIIP